MLKTFLTLIMMVFDEKTKGPVQHFKWNFFDGFGLR